MLQVINGYEQKVSQLMAKASLDMRYMYYFTQPGSYATEFGNNTVYSRNFVSLSKNGDIIGYASYNVDVFAKSVSSLGIISFDIGNIEFARDVRTMFIDIFEKYNLNRISWVCYLDNPVFKSYKKLCEKFGGRICGYEHQVSLLLDGKLHDSATFEILREDYLKSKTNPRNIIRKAV